MNKVRGIDVEELAKARDRVDGLVHQMPPEAASAFMGSLARRSGFSSATSDLHAFMIYALAMQAYLESRVRMGEKTSPNV